MSLDTLHRFMIVKMRERFDRKIRLDAEFNIRRSAQIFLYDPKISTKLDVWVHKMSRSEKKEKKAKKLAGLPRRGRYESFRGRS